MSLRKYFLAIAAFYLILGAALTIDSCTTTQEAGRIAADRDAAIGSLEVRDVQIASLKDAVQRGADDTTKAIAAINTELGGVRDELAQQVADAEPGSEKWKAGVVAFIDGLSSDRDSFMGAITDANAKLQSADDGWGMAEALFSIAGGFFPPAALGGIFIRRGRNVIRELNGEVAEGVVRRVALTQEVESGIIDFNGVIAAMAAGGGPADKGEATRAMMTIPGLKDRVTARRVAIGDKEMKAVKAT